MKDWNVNGDDKLWSKLEVADWTQGAFFFLLQVGCYF
jgi:hypothetical protein